MKISYRNTTIEFDLKELFLFLIVILLIIIAYNIGVYDTIKLTEMCYGYSMQLINMKNPSMGIKNLTIGMP
ncbi:MAG: hypothetical protein QW103_02170 [Candidatus Pacearchaeota archaeon]